MGNGNDSVIAGTGDDSVTIIGDAVVLDHTRAHFIDLGAGDDTLTIKVESLSKIPAIGMLSPLSLVAMATTPW